MDLMDLQLVMIVVLPVGILIGSILCGRDLVKLTESSNVSNGYIKIFIKTLIIFVVLTIVVAVIAYFLGMPLYIFQRDSTFLDYIIRSIKFGSILSFTISSISFFVWMFKATWKGN